MLKVRKEGKPPQPERIPIQMTTTVYTTWTELAGEAIDQAWDVDPNNDLELNDTQRAELYDAAQAHFYSEMAEILAPYGAQMEGDEILGDHDMTNWDCLTAPEEIREAASFIDFDPVLAPYF